jgi:quercetin dioxygenase-like cupin family protein
MLQFNLADELRQLRDLDSWQRSSGRSSKTLVKHPNLHIVLILMKAKSQMSEHHVDAHISIQVLQGKIFVQLPNEKIEIGSGELFALDYGIPHEVEATEESAVLITISWPGGTKEERHARHQGPES